MSAPPAEVVERPAALLEKVVLQGDLSRLSPEERVAYYARVCESLQLNPLTRPFDYLVLNGKLVLYARRDCTEQLRRRDGVSIERLERELIEGVYVVTAHARARDGRVDSSTGCVSVEGLKGEARANAMMKAESKSKRRVTLSICGLGLLDELEVPEEAPAPPAPRPRPEALPRRPAGDAPPEAQAGPAALRVLRDARARRLRPLMARLDYSWADACHYVNRPPETGLSELTDAEFDALCGTMEAQLADAAGTSTR